MIDELMSLQATFFSKKDSIGKQVMRNSVYSFATSIISRFGGLVFTIILARVLMPEMFGLYGLALSIILTAITFTDLGINSAVSRYLAESMGKGKSGAKEARSRLRFLLNIKLILAFGVSAILFLITPAVSVYVLHKPDLIFPLQLGCLYLFAMSIQGFLSTVFYPLRDVKPLLISELISQILRIGIFLLLASTYKNVASAIIALTIATLVSVAFYLVRIMAVRKDIFIGSRIPVERRRLALFIGWTVLLSGSLALFAHIDTFMLGMFVENQFIGYYVVLFSLASSVGAFFSFSSIFLPVFTSLEKERLFSGFSKVTKYSAMFSIPAAAGLAFIIIPVIRIIYGASYAPQEYFLPIMITAAILCLVLIEGVFSPIYSVLLMSKERIKIPAIVLAILTVLNVVINYIFIKCALDYGPIWALVGVALSTLITRYANLFILAGLSKRYFQVSMNRGHIAKPVAASLIMLGFLFAFNMIFAPGIWLSILMILLAAAVYFIALSIINLLWSRQA